MTLEAVNASGGTEMIEIDGDDVEWLGITDGTGTITLDLPELDNDLDGPTQFRLYANDETLTDVYEADNDDYVVEIDGVVSPADADIENIADINTNTYIAADGNNCTAVDRIATITGVQANFVYQLRNFKTGASIGSAVTLDDEDDDLMDDATYPYWDGATTLELNIGKITEELTVEVLVRSQDKGKTLVCDSLIPDDIAEFRIDPTPALYYAVYDDEEGAYSQVFQLVEEGQEFTVCEGSDDYRFYYGYYKEGNWNNINADWYRDQLEKVKSSSSFYDAYDVSGTYQAIYENAGECGGAESVTFSIIVNEKPEQVAISYEGELNLCEGETITLTATEGYTYYRWINDKNNDDNVDPGETLDIYQSSLTVDESGKYQVQVSNVPFDQQCFSVLSNPVEVEIHEFIDGINFLDSEGQAIANNEVKLYGEANTVTLKLDNTKADVTYYLKDESTDVTFATIVGTGTPVEFTTDELVSDMQQFYLEGVWNYDPNCTKIVSANILKVIAMPEMAIYVSDANNNYTYNNYYEISEEGAVYCEGIHLAVGSVEDGVTNTSGTNIKWYKAGYSQSVLNYNRIFGVEEGTYTAVYEDDKGEFEIGSITINAAPERPDLTVNGNLEFCEGMEELTLSAPEGFAGYIWYRNGGVLSNVSSTDNELNVAIAGGYTLAVETAEGCISKQSKEVEVNIHAKPTMPNTGIGGTAWYSVLEPVLCEPGITGVMINNAETNVLYQLINAETGEVLSNQKLGTTGLTLMTNDSVSANVTMAIEAQRVDVDACAVTSLPFDVTAYNLTIVAYGNVLVASVNDAAVASYQWFRNGQMIMNGGNTAQLSILDDAQYSVLVTTYDGCILEATFGTQAAAKKTTASLSTSIYPNPVVNQMTVTMNNMEGDVKVRIYDATGIVRGTYEYNLNNDEETVEKQINLSKLNPGFFTIEIIGNNAKQVKHFIKQ
jgi:hypothetical protein